VHYRLMLLEKVLRPKGEKPRPIPGPLLHAEIGPRQHPGDKSGRRIYIEIAKRRYLPRSNFDTPELEEQLRY
jgi:hypothetical protein